MKKTFRMFGLSVMAAVLSLGLNACGSDDDNVVDEPTKEPVEEPVRTPAVGLYYHEGKEYAIHSASIDYTNLTHNGLFVLAFYDQNGVSIGEVTIKKEMANQVIDLSKKEINKSWRIYANYYEAQISINDYTAEKLADSGTLEVKSFENDIFHVTYNYTKGGKSYNLTCKGKFKGLVY